MKVRNISNQDLKLSLDINSEVKAVTVKPNQVMYCEDKSQVNKQLLIYERKKIISIEKISEKPDHVDHYKSFFESGTYSKPKAAKPIDIDEETETIETPEEHFEIGRFEEIDIEEVDGPEDEPVKKGRGRPKKPVVENDGDSEKKQRGRPKGSTKSKEA